ncbi:hypothetical protein HK105_200683 [Polyrhizophydium stewartii]|uniref:Cyclic nucleotide-binding domain-containing protein n=1 Tax=Polyrhizophydium stewartii TaxID=2732419 RepID=A0ABR4NJS8_9FUNG
MHPVLVTVNPAGFGQLLEIATATLQDLNPETYARLKPHLKEQKWSPGQNIIQHGEHSENVYFMISGTADVVSEFGEVCAQIKANEWFGEVAPFEGVARTASIRAKDPCVTYMIAKEQLKSVLVETPLLEQIDRMSKERMQLYLERSIVA